MIRADALTRNAAWSSPGLRRAWRLAAGIIGLAAASVTPWGAQALTINAYYDSSMTVSYQAAVSNAIAFYQNTFIDPVTVNILFSAGTSGSGGSSLTSLDYFNYADYVAALHADSVIYSNSVEAGADNSINTYNHNSAYYVRSTTANCRALGGICGGGVSAGGYAGLDGSITVASDEFTTPTVIQHEIDEVLGVGGPGTVLGGSTTAGDGHTAIGDLDLFRYNGPNSPSFTTSSSEVSYLSLNGGYGSLARFNQTGVGDYADFTGSPCRVQSFQVCSPAAPISATSPEGLALQAIGYDIAVPEPSGFAILALGISGTMMVSRRRRRPV